MLEPLQRRSPWRIERMAGLPRSGQTDHPERQGIRSRLGSDQFQHLGIPVAPAAAIAPAQPQTGARAIRQRLQPGLQPAIVLPPDRIGAVAQARGTGSNAGKQIQHLKAAIAPAPRKPLQTPQGGVIPLRRGQGGIEANEQQHGTGRIPAALQPPAVAAAGAEGGLGKHWLASARLGAT